MNIKQLRLGNLVKEDVLGLCHVTAIDDEGTVWIDNGDAHYHIDANNIIPISLTDEWLIKFHFSEIVGKRYSLYIGEWYIVASEQYKYIDICMKKDFNTVLRVKNIEYVHQLQNLYYSILGKELTV